MNWGCIRSRCVDGSKPDVFKWSRWVVKCASLAKKSNAWLVLYGRVSGHGQKDDLQTRRERLHMWAQLERKGVETLVLTDIGSGLKATRKQLQRLLKLVCEDKVAEVVITYMACVLTNRRSCCNARQPYSPTPNL